MNRRDSLKTLGAMFGSMAAGTLVSDADAGEYQVPAEMVNRVVICVGSDASLPQVRFFSSLAAALAKMGYPMWMTEDYHPGKVAIYAGGDKHGSFDLSITEDVVMGKKAIARAAIDAYQKRLASPSLTSNAL